MSPERNTEATPPQRRTGTPAYRALYEQIRTGILTGQLRPGSRLPGSRHLAEETGLSRNTVLAAIDQLTVEGYVINRPGSGTYVNTAIPDTTSTPMRPARQPQIASAHNKGLSRYARAIAATPRMPLPALTRQSPLATAFQIGLPALDAFPFREWAQINTRLARERRSDAMSYGHPAGLKALRAEIATYVNTSRGIRCTADQIIVTSGSQQALEFGARVLLDPGDSAWIEDPCYLGVRAVLAGIGAQPIPVPVDDHGLQVDVGVDRSPDSRVAFVTPSHQFPSGVTMSLERRLALIDWAATHDAWIIEDDYDCEFRYRPRPAAALKTIDPNGRVIYIGTFSKTMFPGLRLGYIVAPEALAEIFTAAHLATDIHVSLAEQAAMAEFLASGGYGRHVRRVRNLCAERQQTVVDLINHSQHLTLRDNHTPAGGLHLVAQLPPSVDDATVADAARRAGVHAWPLSLHELDTHHDPQALLLGFAAVTSDQAAQGIHTLDAVIGHFVRTSPEQAESM